MEKKITRSYLKQDKFVEDVGLSWDYVQEHRQAVVRWGSVGLGVIVVAAALWSYMGHQQKVREADLADALRVQTANVGQTQESNPYVASFPTQTEKDKAAEKALSSVANKYSSDREGLVARFFLGSMYADAGKLKDAEQQWKQVADSGDKNLASQAKLSLSQLYAAQGRQAEAEKLLRDLMANPTMMVSKEQAQIALGQLLARNNPVEARKLLEPLRTERAAVSRVAITALNDVPGR